MLSHDYKARFNSTVIEINLANIAKNYNTIRKKLNPNVKCAAMVKGNAYGIGAIPISNALTHAGCEDFWVSNVDEAIILRKECKKANIYVLHGMMCNESCKVCTEYNFMPILNDFFQLELWETHAKNTNNQLPCILNIDTGIGRLGFERNALIENVLMETNYRKHLNFLYIMSHLACSSDKEHYLNSFQLNEMKQLLQQFPNIKITLSDSAGIFLGKDYHFDMVRPGGSLYGVNPTAFKKNPMLNVVTLKAGILQRRVMKTEQNVGYKATYTAKKGDRLLILEYGYHDGYFRSLSNKSYCYAEGYLLPIIGIISMDVLVVDANKLPEELFHTIEFVELMGKNIRVEEVAKYANTDEREIFSQLDNRCKRIYK